MPLAGATILQVVPELSAGGAERTTIEVAQALHGAGARALVASAGGRLEAELASAGGLLVRMPGIGSKNPIDVLRNSGSLAGLIRKEGVRLVHARSRAPAWPALWAARRTQVRFVTTYHGIYNARTALKRTYNSVMARGDVVIANSEFTAAHVRAEHPAAADRLVTIPRGVDLAAFSPERVEASRLTSLAGAWKLDRRAGGPSVILLAGRLTSWKGQREAIAAAALLVERGLSDWRLLLAGDDQGRKDYVSDLASLISDKGLSQHVSIVGHCADMPAAFALADIVIAPSTQPEAFGRVAAEAGAMGKPVVGSNSGGQREVIVHGQTGLLITPGHVGELAEAMQSLLVAAPEVRLTMGAAARKRVLETYSTAALQAATLSVYEKLLGGTHV